MKEKFAGIYRIGSARMQNWDYSWRGQYFITICTRGRVCHFGEIVNEKMILSETGEIAKTQWIKTPEIRPDMNLIMDEFIIMPNHIHGIIQIRENEYNSIIGCDTDTMHRRNAMHGRDTMHRVSTADTNKKSLQKGKNKFGPQRKNLASVIRGFKSSVTKDARLINADFGWQSGFYDIIIRDEKSLNNIRRYLKNNPGKWTSDELNAENE